MLDNFFEPRVEGYNNGWLGDFVARYRFIVCCQPSRGSLLADGSKYPKGFKILEISDRSSLNKGRRLAET